MNHKNLIEKLQHKIDHKTKPLGALGMLEKLALQIGKVQNSLTPSLQNPALLVFAGDHGIAKEAVSAYPQEVTYQMVLNFLQGGAGINVFCKQHAIQLQIIDSGVNADFDYDEQLVNAKVAKGTASFLSAPAMTKDQFDFGWEKSNALVDEIHEKGCNIIGFGEMGIGNTSASTMLMSYLCDMPIEKCTGRGTGLDDAQLNKKMETLHRAREFHGTITDPKKVLQTFAGFEMVQMCAAMLRAYHHNMLLMIDGFIASSVLLAAVRINPKIMENAIFCHLSDEFAHRMLLDYLQAEPILQLSMRLGEGVGCAIAYPIIKSAVLFLNEMASFESATVSNKA